MFDGDFYSAWRARHESEHHDQNLQILERLIEARPDDPELHLLLAVTLLALGRHAESNSATRRAIDLGPNDAAALTRAGSLSFYDGDLDMARECVYRAKRVASRGFPLSGELGELGRNLKRREKGADQEKKLSDLFDAEPRDRHVAADLARHLIRTGRDYAAYYVVARGLHYHPDDNRLRRLERKLGKTVPRDERDEAQRWAGSGEPRSVPYSRPVKADQRRKA